MQYYSTHKKSKTLSFKQGSQKGLAVDGGIYFPEIIPTLSKDTIHSFSEMTLPEIAVEVLTPYCTPDLDKQILKSICEETYSFDIPLKKIEDNIYTLELFRGPTCAFKDIGARFLARCLTQFKENEHPVKVLVATSGDTGSAVANAFLGLEGIEVIVLYPHNKVSEIQEKQFTTLGKNTKAIAIKGNFDDCQRLVKQAFSDLELNEQITLASANSINIARWLPQSVYYFYAYTQWHKENSKKELVFSVPSGNFGNLAAGALAQQMGLPIHHFIAATNANKVVPDYLQTGTYTPKSSIETIANAMDVGNPNNFDRILELYNHDFPKISKNIKGFWATDEQTRDTIRQVYRNTGYICDPHGAIGYFGLKGSLDQNSYDGIFLETAHPAKFKDTMEETLDIEVALPKQLEHFMGLETKYQLMENDYGAFKAYLYSGIGSK